jgi:hypothetical protein
MPNRQDHAMGCTVGVAFLPAGVLAFKNRDLGKKYITRRMYTFETTPLFRALRGINLKQECLEGVSIGVNRYGIVVANTHVATTPHMTYDMLCEEILRSARARRDIPRIVTEFMNEHSLQGGRIMVVGLRWGYLVEVYGHEYRLETLRGHRAITNHFSLIPRRRKGLNKPGTSSLTRLKTAGRLLKDIKNIGEIKSLLRSHIPAKSGNSICRHDPACATESSHIISIGKEHITWSSLVGNPCEHDYQTMEVF